MVPDPTVLDLLVPTLKQPVKMEDSIIEVLKYSQRDMDTSLQRAEKQVSVCSLCNTRLCDTSGSFIFYFPLLGGGEATTKECSD